ncbi:MAG: IS5/IS1182 family transposase, partial [Acinetobacter sp.]
LCVRNFQSLFNEIYTRIAVLNKFTELNRSNIQVAS